MMSRLSPALFLGALIFVLAAPAPVRSRGEKEPQLIEVQGVGSARPSSSSDECRPDWGWDEPTCKLFAEATVYTDKGYKYWYLVNHIGDWARNNPDWVKQNNQSPWHPFLNAAPKEDGEHRRYLWGQLDKALAGGNRDQDGRTDDAYDKDAAALRSALYHLPMEQHYRVAFLFATQQIMISTFGTGNAWKKMKAGIDGGSTDQPVKCGHYAEHLLKNMLTAFPGLRPWSQYQLIANRNKHGINDHVAGCYIYEHGGKRVEIVADAYKGRFSTGVFWWMTEDDKVYKKLIKKNESRNPKAWCDGDMIHK